MNIDDVKQEISQKTGIPEMLLTGETIEEDIAKAKAILAYRKEAEQARPKSAREGFCEWMNAQEGIEQPDAAGQALEAIEKEAAGDFSAHYPLIRDAGEVEVGSATNDARKAFAEWAGQKMAFDPTRTADGWSSYLP